MLANRSRSHRGIRRTAEDWIVDITLWIVMTAVFIITLYPFYYIVINSLNEGLDAVKGGIYFWPRKFTLDNYVQFLSDSKWLLAITVTVARTTLGAALCVLFTCMVAYGMSFKNLALRNVYFAIVLVCMYFDGGLIPYFLTLKSVGLINRFLVYILPNMFSIYYMILAISFFKELPVELYESAYLDGANEFLVFFRIVLPLSTPLLATLALFSAVGHWNSWMDTAFFATANKNLRTLAYLMRDIIMRNETGVRGAAAVAQGSRMTVTSTSIQMAAMIIAVLPIICVYPFLQKYFVKGIMLGAVKG